MKKSTAIISTLSLAGIFAVTALTVLAESNDHESDRQYVGTTAFKSEQKDKNEHEAKNNEIKDDRGHEDTEDDNAGDNDDAAEIVLHGHVSSMPDIKVAVIIPEVSSTTIITYADVVSILTQYQNAIKTITISGTLGDASSTLSVQEKAILSKLMNKHTDNFDRLKARANDLSLQIKDLIDVLTPLGSTTINSSFNLKGLILSQLKDFRNAINDLKDLGDSSVDIIDQETN